MSHLIYRSQGIVIAHMPRGDHDRVLLLLTRDHGLLHVFVKNVRSLQSKLRYGTQLFATGEYEYIRGKDMWRLVGVTDIDQFEPRDTALAGRLVYDVESFLHGEEPCPEIFDEVIACLDYFEYEEGILRDQLLLSLATITASLGYLDMDEIARFETPLSQRDRVYLERLYDKARTGARL